MIVSLADSTNNPITDNKLTFVLTLALTGTGRDDQDLQRVPLLLETLEHYFDKRFLDQLLIVTPAHDKPKVQKAIGGRISSSKTTLLDQDDICPEFRSDPDTTHSWPKPNKGWHRQQLLKLAIHEHVRTSFYMTLDSDVLFVRHFDTSSLITGGKAKLNLLRQSDFKRLFQEDIARHEIKVRQLRIGQAERVLHVKRSPELEGQWYGETPVLINCQVVGELAKYVETTWGKPWRQALLDNFPWTEYTIYFLFAEEKDLLWKFYRPGNSNSVLRLNQSLWRPGNEYKVYRDLSTWEPEVIFGSSDEGVAIVVQSYLGYPVSTVAQMIKPYIK